MFAGKKKLFLFALITLGVLLISSCGQQQPVRPTLIQSNSATPSNTITSLPAFTPTNTSSPTLEPTLTPTLAQTNTPGPSPTDTEWLVTKVPLVLETPTAISTPVVGPMNFELKAWGEQDALNLITLAEQFSYADNVPFPSNDSRYNFVSDQAAVKLAAIEALHRFPQAASAKKLEWRIALANTIMGMQDSDLWILQELEKGLNDGSYPLDGLKKALNPYGFTASLSDPIPNLMGRNQLGQVLRIFWLDTPSISSMESPSTSLYAGLGKDNEGHYRLTKIYSTWSFTHDYDEPYSLKERTGDGIPEIAFFPSYTNGSWCGYAIVIYQWQNDRFADLSHDQFHFDSCSGGENTWEYGAPDARGALPIITRKPISYYSNIFRVNTYQWDGKTYVLTKTKVEPPDLEDEPHEQIAEWMLYTTGVEEYESLIKQIPIFLSIEGVDRTYLQFQLGYAYASLGREAPALKIFREIAAHTEDALPTTIPQAAQAFLDNYRGRKDIYRACQASLKIINAAAGERFYGWESSDGEYVLKQVGFYYYSPAWGQATLCNLRGAFYALISGLNKTQFAKAPETLQKQGVLIHSANTVDVNGDGELEWVLLVDTPGERSPVDSWILVNGTKKIVALPIADWNRRHFDLPSGNIDAMKWDVKTAKAPNGETIAIIQLGKYLFFFQINAQKDAFEWRMDPLSDIKSYTIRQSDVNFEIEVVRNDYSSLFLWSNKKSAIVYDFQETDQSPLRKAEEALLIRWQPSEAIPSLESILENPDFENPYLVYLLGLAYELTGDRDKAVQAYWELWQKYPVSLYARFAQAKIDLNTHPLASP